MLLARRGFAVGIGLVSTVTIARLVGPRAYGLANMSAVILALAQMFRDFGLTSAVLRKGTVSPSELNFLFWFNAATTLGLALLIAAAAPFAGAFYKEPIVPWVILASLVGFTLGGLSLQHRALMTREMRFGEIALIDTLALATNFIVALAVALVRHDVWAIVAGNVAQSTVTSAIYVARVKWRPGRPARTAGMRELFRFGANTSIFSLSSFVSNNVAPIIIGHAMGSSLLGQFNRAQSLYGLPINNVIQPITQATLPLLTHLRAHPTQYREAYLQLVRKLCMVLLPFSVALSFGATSLVMTLLGARWHPAGVVLTCLAPTLSAIGLSYSVSDLYVTQDRSAELRTLGLFEMIFRVGSIALGVPFGLVGVSVGFTVSTIVVCVVRMVVAGRKGPVTIRDQLGAAAPAVPVAIGALVGSLAVQGLIATHPVAWPLRAVLFFGAAATLSLIAGIVVPASRSALLDLAATFKIPGLARFRVSAPRSA